MSTTDVRDDVRKRYGQLATKSSESCCSPAPAQANSCCGGTPDTAQVPMSKLVGYSDDDLASLPEGADLGVGCGNPLAFSSVKEGDTVVDLGSGAGIDCFLAAQKVGETGRVIGVDMTPEMLTKARANAESGGYTNVEFREGVIEDLPLEDNSVDIVISNCVINLSPDKAKVFAEIHRVLKPGGKYFVSDIVLRGELPEIIKNSPAVYSACVSGALQKEEYIGISEMLGFQHIEVMSEAVYPLDALTEDPTVKGLMSELEGVSQDDFQKAADCVVSIKLTATK